MHWEAGRSQEQIATSLGVDRKTVRKYLAPAVAAGIVPGGRRPVAEWAADAQVVPGVGRYPVAADDVAADRAAPGLHRRRSSSCGGDEATIRQRLRDEQGLAASVGVAAAVDRGEPGRGGAAGAGDGAAEDRPAGQEAQIDYG